MNTVKVSQIVPFAISEQAGLTLRCSIMSAIEGAKDQRIILDFEGVKIFTSMFFNASIGYFVLSKGKDYVDNHIHMVNLSELGSETLQHSMNNAEIVARNREIDNIETDKIIESACDEFDI